MMLMVMGVLAGCSGSAISSGLDDYGPLPRAPTDVAASRSPSGAYLSGRMAESANQDRSALDFYLETLARAPDASIVAERLISVAIAEGKFDLASQIATRLSKRAPGAPLPELLLTVEALRSGRGGKAVEHANSLPPIGFYRLSGALTRAWAQVEAGELRPGHADAEAAALKALNPLGENAITEPMRVLHTALIEDLAGDMTAAASDYRRAIAMGRPPLRLAELAGNFFERIGLRDEAAKLYKDVAANGQGSFGFVPVLAPSPPPRLIADARAGLAEGLFDMASLMSRAHSTEGTMISTRLALRLKPDFALAEIVLGDALTAENRMDEALAVYRGVNSRSPYRWSAQLSEAQLLIAGKKWPEAEAVLKRMIAERPDDSVPLETLGDAARTAAHYAEAVDWYDKALALLGSAGSPEQAQLLYFDRGIAYERSAQWQKAKADLRHALSVRPGNAQIENYLGYAMVERGEQLQDGLKLIQQAVSDAPEDGYIVDSLGWAYYRLGQFPKASATLEHAIELTPADAEITSHLGDAYWQTGRGAEARLEWHRALDLKPSPDLARQITQKLGKPPSRRAEGVAEVGSSAAITRSD